MPRILKQSEFLAGDFDHTGLNVHVRPGRRATAAVVFVHGLGGDGYDTWGMWPEFVFEQSSAELLDVIIFSYASFNKAWRTRKSGADLPFVAAQLADWIRSLTEEHGYTDVYFVAHSLGGLVVESAVQQYLNQLGTGAPEVTSIAAIFVLAAPRLGAGIALGALRQLIPEIEWLRNKSPQLLAAESFFSSRVESLGTAASAGYREFLIPRYSAMAGGDRVVSKMSGLFGVPEQQRLRLNGNHHTIAKPDRINQEQHLRLLRIVKQSGDIRRAWRRQSHHAEKFKVRPGPRAPVLVTELRSDDIKVTWEQAYNRALALASSDEISVSDCRNSTVTSSHRETDILVSVHATENIMNRDERCEAVVRGSFAQHQRQHGLMLLIVAIGAAHERARDVVQSWLPDPPYRSLSIEGVASPEEFSDLLAAWAEVMIDRDPARWPRSTSEMSYGTEGSDLV
ncbi:MULTISPECIES: alpha/beta hydrolase [unclassified Streptomyces]|uniref:alpha/beta fold hydrolase n=1 Tax=unclassified Streptomyces TaxID=2593676 RepID=UPI0009A0ECE7|nr:alpha/beta hydrolase [Streptomyces sp. SAT1]